MWNLLSDWTNIDPYSKECGLSSDQDQTVHIHNCVNANNPFPVQYTQYFVLLDVLITSCIPN